LSDVTGAPPGTDRTLLRRAYANGSKFARRRELYAHLEPRVDFLGWTLSHVELPRDGRLLDVGCGPGYYLSRLASEPITRLGCDLSEGMVRQARGAADAVWAVADVTQLPVAPGSCDVVLAMHMLYHVPDIPEAVAELRRVTRSGGAVLVSTLGRGHLERVRSIVADAIGGPHLERPSGRFRLEDAGAVLATHFDTVDRDDLRGEVVVRDPGPVLRHVGSGRDFYEPLLPSGTTWDGVLAYVDAAVRDEIARSGAFRTPTHTGVLVCR
jgi:SAM-dependent methyltransferase